MHEFMHPSFGYLVCFVHDLIASTSHLAKGLRKQVRVASIWVSNKIQPCCCMNFPRTRWEKVRVGYAERTALKQVYYLG